MKKHTKLNKPRPIKALYEIVFTGSYMRAENELSKGFGLNVRTVANDAEEAIKKLRKWAVNVQTITSVARTGIIHVP